MAWVRTLLVVTATQFCNAYVVPRETSTTTPQPVFGETTAPQWWERPDVKKGLIGGAAAAGLAAFGGLGIAAMVQAAKPTTTMLSTLPPAPALRAAPLPLGAAPTLPMAASRAAPLPFGAAPSRPMAASPATVSASPRFRKSEDESGISPFLIGLLILVALLCCCGFVAFCMWLQNSKKRSTRSTVRAEEEDRDLDFEETETAPLVSAPPPAPAALSPQQSYAPLFPFAAPTTSVPSYAPGASYVPSVSPMMAPASTLVAPSTTYPYGNALPGTYQYGNTLPATTATYQYGNTLPATTATYPYGNTLPATTATYPYGNTLPAVAYA